MSSIYILWDDSHIWGLLVKRALEAWNIDHELVRGHQIAQGLLSGKPPAALIVPGGWAKGKAKHLGGPGIVEIQKYVGEGGNYLGFCGGAGLGLSGAGGLCLSCWQRKGFENRLHHFLSGHINVKLDQSNPLVPDSLGESALIPVWWPGQFSRTSAIPQPPLAAIANREMISGWQTCASALCRKELSTTGIICTASPCFLNFYMTVRPLFADRLEKANSY